MDPWALTDEAGNQRSRNLILPQFSSRTEDNNPYMCHHASTRIFTISRDRLSDVHDVDNLCLPDGVSLHVYGCVFGQVCTSVVVASKTVFHLRRVHG